jgi:hypothetical protein
MAPMVVDDFVGYGRRNRQGGSTIASGMGGEIVKGGSTIASGMGGEIVKVGRRFRGCAYVFGYTQATFQRALFLPPTHLRGFLAG